MAKRKKKRKRATEDQVVEAVRAYALEFWGQQLRGLTVLAAVELQTDEERQGEDLLGYALEASHNWGQQQLNRCHRELKRLGMSTSSVERFFADHGWVFDKKRKGWSPDYKTGIVMLYVHTEGPSFVDILRANLAAAGRDLSDAEVAELERAMAEAVGQEASGKERGKWSLNEVLGKG